MTRRTNPGFLSDDETARDSHRTKDMVESFTKWKGIAIIGETENFIVEYDSKEKMVFIHEKQEISGCSFKLGFCKDEIEKIIRLLVKAKSSFELGHV